MKIKLKTETTFDAAHHLVGYDGDCQRIHGHTWRVIVWVEGDIKDCDSVGILWDFKNLKSILKDFDHHDLNKVLPINPTAENILSWLLIKLKKDSPYLIFKIRVYESPKSYAEGEL